MNDRKYYWLKLHKDFFKRHDIRIIEDMPNGKDYILFYLKLLVESVTHDGELRFSETIPYNETMLSTVTNTNIDIVRSALKVFSELNMIEVLEDQTIFMTEVNKMIGSSTQDDHTRESTRNRVRAFRERQKQLSDNEKRYSNVTCNGEIDKEIDIDIKKEINKERNVTVTNDFDFENAFNKTFELYPKKSDMSNARGEWCSMVATIVDEENRIEFTKDIYKATKMYLNDYKKTRPDDKEFIYIPKYAKWLQQDADYWLRKVEEGKLKNEQ